MTSKKILIRLLLIILVFGFSTESSAQFWKKKKEVPKRVDKPKPKKK